MEQAQDDQGDTNNPNSRTGLKNSITRLKDKFLPGIEYTLLLSLIVYFAMLIVGCINVHNCPVNKSIPLFLIITGAIGLMSKFVTYIRERLARFMQVKYLISVLYLIETFVLGLGIYWVYTEFKPSFQPADKQYCDKTTYMFAFIYITICITIAIATILGFICFAICAYFVAKTAENSYDPEAQTTISSAEPSNYSTIKNEP